MASGGPHEEEASKSGGAAGKWPPGFSAATREWMHNEISGWLDDVPINLPGNLSEAQRAEALARAASNQERRRYWYHWYQENLAGARRQPSLAGQQVAPCNEEQVHTFGVISVGFF